MFWFMIRVLLMSMLLFLAGCITIEKESSGAPPPSSSDAQTTQEFGTPGKCQAGFACKNKQDFKETQLCLLGAAQATADATCCPFLDKNIKDDEGLLFVEKCWCYVAGWRDDARYCANISSSDLKQFCLQGGCKQAVKQ